MAVYVRKSAGLAGIDPETGKDILKVTYKIGFTDQLPERREAQHNTSDPGGKTVYFFENLGRAEEKLLHRYFRDFRAYPGKSVEVFFHDPCMDELFESPDIVEALEGISGSMVRDISEVPKDLLSDIRELSEILGATDEVTTKVLSRYCVYNLKTAYHEFTKLLGSDVPLEVLSRSLNFVMTTNHVRTPPTVKTTMALKKKDLSEESIKYKNIHTLEERVKYLKSLLPSQANRVYYELSDSMEGDCALRMFSVIGQDGLIVVDRSTSELVEKNKDPKTGKPREGYRYSTFFIKYSRCILAFQGVTLKFPNKWVETRLAFDPRFEYNQDTSEISGNVCDIIRNLLESRMVFNSLKGGYRLATMKHLIVLLMKHYDIVSYDETTKQVTIRPKSKP